MRRFEDKVVLVTGAARGQGRSHAVGFAEEGARVVVCDVVKDIDSVPYEMGSREDLDATVALVKEAGQECLAVEADVRDGRQLDDVVAQGIELFGAIDVLVANAGIASISTIAEMTDDQWQTMVDINLSGVFKSIRAVIPHMVERGRGRIVATSSIVGRLGAPNIADYVAAKWGVIGLVKSAALELADKGITVNAVAPTSVNTRMIQNNAFHALFLPGSTTPPKNKCRPRTSH